MAIDYTAGLPAAFEYPFAQCPEPGMRDAVNMWVSDDNGAISIPRFAVEAAAPGLKGASEGYGGRELSWEMHDLQLNLGFPDGRLYRLREPGKTWKTIGSEGQHSILGAGPLGFHCIEPFRHWTASFKGEATRHSVRALMRGDEQGPRVPLEFEIDTHSAVPPWSVGTLTNDEGVEAAKNYMGGVGGDRFEQLFRAKGVVRIDGEEHRFTGSGLRIRRKGIRSIGGFWGHCWMSALFPSGKAFGCNIYPPHEGGLPSLNEGFLFTGDGPLIPARVVKAPWLRKIVAKDEDVTVVLETAQGLTTVEGETIVPVHDVKERSYGGQEFPVLCQAGARYRWDGEETYGMIERSSMRKLIAF